MIIMMTIQNLMTSLSSDHWGKQWASGHQAIPSRQHLQNKSWQLNQLLCRSNHYMISIDRSICSRRRRMKAHLGHRQQRRYLIKPLNDCFCPRMYIFTEGRIQMNPVSNWLHGKLEICGDMSTLLTTWQAPSLVQNDIPSRLCQVFRRWSWHMWSL